MNHKKYRERVGSRAAYYREWRQKKKATKEEKAGNPNQYLNSNNATSRNNQPIAQHVSNYTLQDVENACILDGIPKMNAQSHFNHYNSQGFKKANGHEITCLQSHIAKRWNKSQVCWDFDVSRTNRTDSVADQVQKLKNEGRL